MFADFRTVEYQMQKESVRFSCFYLNASQNSEVQSIAWITIEKFTKKRWTFAILMGCTNHIWCGVQEQDDFKLDKHHFTTTTTKTHVKNQSHIYKHTHAYTHNERDRNTGGKNTLFTHTNDIIVQAKHQKIRTEIVQGLCFT